MRVETTDKIAHDHGVKMLIYGPAGCGKTYLCATAPKPFIISAESGLLSLSHVSVPCIQVTNYKDLIEACDYVTRANILKYYDTLCLDSISEIAEVVLAASKAATKDGRLAYGSMVDSMLPMIKRLRDLKGKHVLVTAKENSIVNTLTGAVMTGPDTPGKELPKQLPYMFDEVFYLNMFRTQDQQMTRALRTQPDFGIIAKDRSGKLAELEPPNLTQIINKIKGR